MNWFSLVTVLIEMFKPIIKKWLEDLLKKVAADLTAGRVELHGHPVIDVADVFAAARAEVVDTYWFPRRALKALDAMQRTAIAHAHEVQDAAAGKAFVPVLTGKEYDALQGL